MKSKCILKFNKGFVLVVLFGLAQYSGAEDLVQAFQKALENDPQYLGAQNVYNSAHENKRQAFGRMLPQLNAEYSRGYTKNETKAVESALFNLGAQEGGFEENKYKSESYILSLSQPIFNWGLIKGYSDAKAQFAYATAEYESKKQDLMLRTTERYLAALAAEDAIGFSIAEKAAVQKQLQLVEAMMRGGSARKTELYDAQARFASVEADEINARFQHSDRIEALSEVIGPFSGKLVPLQTKIDLVEPSPNKPVEWTKSALQQNPRVVMLRRAVDSSRAKISVEKSGHYPSVNFTARYDGTNDLEIDPINDQKSTGLYLNVNLPLYSGGIVRSRGKQAREMYLKSKHDLTEMQRSIDRSTKSAFYGIKSAISRTQALSKSVRAQELALTAKQKGFRAGLNTGIDVLDAQRELHKVKRDYSRAMYEYIINSLRLKHAVGTLSESDLQKVNGWLQAE